jgi:hypothetical protein
MDDEEDDLWLLAGQGTARAAVDRLAPDAPFLEDDHDALLALWQEIENELLLEAAAAELELDDLVEEHERAEEHALAALTASLSLHDPSAVACPVCLTRLLRMRQCLIYCDCGLRLNTQDEGMSLANFSHLLQQLLAQHGAGGCTAVPTFVTERAALGQPPCSLLRASCAACGFLALL